MLAGTSTNKPSNANQHHSSKEDTAMEKGARWGGERGEERTLNLVLTFQFFRERFLPASHISYE
jgi:hypothetical protein